MGSQDCGYVYGHFYFGWEQQQRKTPNTQGTSNYSMLGLQGEESEDMFEVQTQQVCKPLSEYLIRNLI